MHTYSKHIMNRQKIDYDCISNIYKCCVFNKQHGNILNDSGKEKEVKYYLIGIIEKLNKDYESLTKIEDNLKILYRIWQSKRIHTQRKNTESNDEEEEVYYNHKFQKLQ